VKEKQLKVGQIKALSEVKKEFGADAYRGLMKYVPQKEHVLTEKRIDGLKQEDDFRILSKLMQPDCEAIKLRVGNGQEGIYLPDFLCWFAPGSRMWGLNKSLMKGYTCFVETKVRDDDSATYLEPLVRHQRDFAKKFNLPVLFATRFTNKILPTRWVITEAKANAVLTHKPDDIGMAPLLMDDYFLFLRSNYEFIETLENHSGQCGHIKRRRLGCFLTVEIVQGSKKVKIPDYISPILSVFISGYADPTTVKETHVGKKTKLSYNLSQGLVLFSAAFNSIISRANLNDKESPLTRNMVEEAIGPLKSMGIVLPIAAYSEKLTSKLWQSLGGRLDAS
jgi:hypothetical protein